MRGAIRYSTSDSCQTVKIVIFLWLQHGATTYHSWKTVNQLFCHSSFLFLANATNCSVCDSCQTVEIIDFLWLQQVQVLTMAEKPLSQLFFHSSVASCLFLASAMQYNTSDICQTVKIVIFYG